MIVTELPTDILSLVLVRLGHGTGRARDIARTGPTCRIIREPFRGCTVDCSGWMGYHT